MGEYARDGGLNYEIALRVIGRHLDGEPAYHVSILEVDDGFTVRYQPAQHHAEDKIIHFSRTKLKDLYIFQSAGRGVTRKHERRAGMWTNFVHGHQEFFRALGFALDQDRATSMALDELEDEVRVSYVYTDPQNPLRSLKRHVNMREQDIQMMVESARQRREVKFMLVRG